MMGRKYTMYKGECINPALNKLMCELGHTDKICICDAGLPIPTDITRIDLAWKKSRPEWLEICRLIKNNIHIEKIYLSEEIKEKSQQIHAEFLEMFESYEIIYVKHERFKGNLKNCKGVVRTGEFTPFANCIIEIGVGF